MASASFAIDPPKPSNAQLLDIRRDELQAVYKEPTNKELDIHDVADVRVAINHWLAANKRGLA